MLHLIKGSLKQIIVEGDIPISNKIQTNHPAETKPERHAEGNREADFEVDFDDQFAEDQELESPVIDMHELEELREHYRREGEEQARDLVRKAEIELARAKEDADKIRRQADNERMEKLRAMEADSAKARETAKQEGYQEGYQEGQQAGQKDGYQAGYQSGYGEGTKKGTDDGYVQGLKKCKETLLDLKNICEGVEKEKTALIAENRRGIFDMAMGVAEKITATVFRQKDKQALQKMITEAAKEFRNAKSVRVTLSKLDLSEDIETDLRILEKCFPDTAQVEFEVLEDAERGTLLVETDTEILDAGVSTQLRMIEELGKGKFRDREPEPEDTDEIGEAVRTERPRKIRKAEKPREPEAAEETAVMEETPEEPTGNTAQEQEVTEEQ